MVNAFLSFNKKRNSREQLNLKRLRLSVALGLIGTEERAAKEERSTSELLTITKVTYITKFVMNVIYTFDLCPHMLINIVK